LRNPGQSLDEEIQRVIDDQLTGPYIAVVMLWAMAGVEWFGYLRSMPRRPWLFSIVAVIGTIWLVWKALRSRTRVRNLRQGRDGERVVGQFLEGLRENGARIFHDVPGEGFNLDHVVISTRGIYVIETKTISKPSPDAKVVFDGERVTVAGRQPDRNPVTQAAAEADWLRRALAMSTGRALPVRGVVVYPGWWIEQVNREHRRDVWVLEPKALPGFIEHEPAVVSPDDMTLAAFHLSRYVRNANSSI
jgi:hypothetical protein